MSANWFSVSKATLIDILTKLSVVFDTKADASHSHTKNDITDFPTLGTAAAKDVPSSGNATSSQVVMGNDTRLSDSRPASDVYTWAKAASKPTYTASEVGAIALTLKGANNGVAELDSNGKVPSSQLPSYVDDVVEGYYNSSTDRFYQESTFTTVIPPESGKSWVDMPSNKSYRWTGSVYTRVDEGVQLGETSSTAYRGDKGKIAYDHSQLTSGNPHNVTKSDVGLGNVGNFKAVSTVASQGLSDTEKSNARANIGAGTSNFSGSYNALSDIPSSFTPSSHTHTLDEVSDGSTRKLANYLPLSGGTLTGTLNMAGKDINLSTTGSSSNDSADIIFWYGSGQEKARIWTDDTYTTAQGPKFRLYKADGTSLANTRLALYTEIPTTLDGISDGTNRKLTNAKPNTTGSMNAVAAYGNSMGMVNLGNTARDTKIDPNGQTGWHHFINMSYNTESSNMWQTQIAIKAGTTNPWIRSRSGGTISDSTAWGAPWVRIWTESNLTNLNQLANGPGYLTSVSWNDVGSKPSSFTPSSHTHGNIQNGGTLQTNDITIANGDKLVVTDSSDSSKIARASISFDGSTATKCLTQKGTWESFTNNANDAVKQTRNYSTDSSYRLIVSGTADDVTRTEGVYKTDYIRVNPKYGSFSFYNYSGKPTITLCGYSFSTSTSENTTSYLSLGNQTANSTAGGRSGRLTLFGTGTYYTDIKATQTDNRTVEIADGDGYIPVYNTTAVGDDDSSGYYLYISNTASKYGIVNRHRLKYSPYKGKLYCLNSKEKESWAIYDYDIDATGLYSTQLVLGNSDRSGQYVGGRYGIISLYSSSGSKMDIRTDTTSSNTVYIADQAGKIPVLTSTTNSDTTEHYLYFGGSNGKAYYRSSFCFKPSAANLYCNNSAGRRSWSVWDEGITTTSSTWVTLELGNSTASGTTGARRGRIYLNSDGSSGVTLTAASDGGFYINQYAAIVTHDANNWRLAQMIPTESYVHCNTSNGAYGINWWASDTKLKKNIEGTKVTALDKVDRIDFIQFDWKKDSAHVDLGVSANQIEEFMPDAVWNIKQPEDYEYDIIKNIDTGKMATYALKAIQELHKVVKDQAAEIAELKSKLA